VAPYARSNLPAINMNNARSSTAGSGGAARAPGRAQPTSAAGAGVKGAASAKERASQINQQEAELAYWRQQWAARKAREKLGQKAKEKSSMARRRTASKPRRSQAAAPKQVVGASKWDLLASLVVVLCIVRLARTGLKAQLDAANNRIETEVKMRSQLEQAQKSMVLQQQSVVQRLSTELQRSSTALDAANNRIETEVKMRSQLEQAQKSIVLQQQSENETWTITPTSFDDSAYWKYRISYQDVASGALARETREFNMAWSQYHRLFPRASTIPGQPNSIRFIDVYDNPAVALQYKTTKARFRQAGIPTNEVAVFHGTPTANVQKIMAGGFQVGGRGVPVANGVAHGTGVYTAENPATAQGYTRGSSCVIMSHALPGRVGHGSGSGLDSWVVKGDWRIFRDGDQLWPRYVIHYN
jgi:hypothetical protein